MIDMEVSGYVRSDNVHKAPGAVFADFHREVNMTWPYFRAGVVMDVAM